MEYKLYTKWKAYKIQSYFTESFSSSSHSENLSLKVTLKKLIHWNSQKIIQKKVLLKFALKPYLCYSGMQETVNLPPFFIIILFCILYFFFIWTKCCFKFKTIHKLHRISYNHTENLHPIIIRLGSHCFKKILFWIALIMSDKDNAENYTERALKNFHCSIFFYSAIGLTIFRVAVIFQCHFQRQNCHSVKSETGHEKIPKRNHT